MILLVATLTAGAHPSGHARAQLLTAELGDGCDAAILARRAQAWADEEHVDQALADLALARTCATDPLALDQVEAPLRAARGEHEAARVLFDRILAAHPTDRVAHLGRARSLAALGRPDDADAAYGTALADAPDLRPDDAVEWARLRLDADRPDDAAEVVALGIRRCGEVPALRDLAVDVDIARGDLEGAIERLEAAVARSPRSLGLLLRQARLHARAGQTTQAIAAARAVVDRYDELPARLQNDAMTQVRDDAEALIAATH